MDDRPERADELTPELNRTWQEERDEVWRLPFDFQAARARGYEGTESEAYTALGELLADRGQEEDALAALHHAAELDSENSLACYRIGQLHLRAGRLEKAADAFAASAAILPDHWVIHLNLGKALAGAARHEEAIDAFTRAAVLCPGAARPLVLRAQCRAALGRLDQAITDLEKALRIEPQSRRYQRLLKSLHQQKADTAAEGA